MDCLGIYTHIGIHPRNHQDVVKQQGVDVQMCVCLQIGPLKPRTRLPGTLDQRLVECNETRFVLLCLLRADISGLDAAIHLDSALATDQAVSSLIAPNVFRPSTSHWSACRCETR